MKRILLAATAIASSALAVTPATAAVSVTATPGCAVYCGPTPITYDFDGNSPITLGGGIVGPGTTSGSFAQPLGSTGQYFSVGPSTSTPANVTIGDNISNFSLIWGSLDLYNTLTLNTMAGSYIFTGADIAALIPGIANGDQSAANTNPIVTFFLTGPDQTAVNFNMASTQNAFEIDNIAVNAAVPEPATWAMMLLGFAGIGMAVRRSRKPVLAQIA